MAIDQNFERYTRQFETGEPLLYPALHAPVFRTEKGTPYLQESGVVMIAQSVPHLQGLQGFLAGFDPTLGFTDYLSDPTAIPPSTQLIKTAGQACYMSFGPKRTMNDNAERYLENIIQSGHGSVLEHAYFTFLLYGVSRTFTHELVRHRAGMAFSQESQRYVSGKVLRFVERLEFQEDQKLHRKFLERIDANATDYADITEELITLRDADSSVFIAQSATDKRKEVQQTARDVLINATEAVIVTTGNVRSWRHILNMRGSEHAEKEIRRVAYKLYVCLSAVDPISFADFSAEPLADGTFALKTKYPKV